MFRPIAATLLMLCSVALADNAPAPPMIGTRAGQVRDDNALQMKLVWIPPGQFTMRSPKDEKGRNDNEAQVPVTLTKGFWLGQHEVTQAEWQHVMQTTPWSGHFAKEGENYPATEVGWDDALKFCAKLTEQERRAGRLPSNGQYTLPTEAQWEYACRAGTKSRFSFGDNDSDLSDYAWWSGIGGEGNAKKEQDAHQVGQKKANPWGLYDMHGNVFEWCRNRYAEELAGGTDPQGRSKRGRSSFRPTIGAAALAGDHRPPPAWLVGTHIELREA